ncbi:MAG: M48 family metallopeptidase [Bacillus sp. (in: firmicutes)]
MSSISINKMEEEVSTECPNCLKTIPVHKGYITWCECGYNLHTAKEEEPKRKSRMVRLYDHLGERSGEFIFQQMMNTTNFTQRKSIVNMIALMIATIVHTISVASFVFGVYLLFFQHNHFILLFFGLVLLGIAWFTRPRVGKLEKNERIIPKDEMPATYAVLDDLADAMGIKKIDGIIINEDYNAAITKIGWRRRTIVFIGVPLFSALTPDEQCSVFAHELGHYQNKDLTYGFYVGTAINTLYDWYTLLDPVQSEQTFEYSLLDMITNFILKLLAQIPYLTFSLLLHLLWNQKQIGEYLADYRAAQICGSMTVIKDLEKIHMDRVYYHALSRVSVNDLQTNVIDEFKQALSIMPEREKIRIKLQLAKEKFKLNATHPPTIYRIQFIEKQNLTGRFSIDPLKGKKMIQELDLFKEKIHEIAVENYRYYWLN